MMQMVLLCGGLGTRLKSVAPDTPKALVPVAGKPFIEHQFDLLRASGIRDVVLCTGHFGEKIEAHVGNGSRFGLNVQYARENPSSLLGTGGALVNALPLLQDRFMMMYGDSYLPVDYAALARWFMDSSWDAVMTVYRNEEKWDSSNTRIKGDRVVYYSKRAKPGEADYIDYGLLLFKRPVIFAYADCVPPLDLAVVQEDLVNEGLLGAYPVAERFYEIGKPEGLAELDALLRADNHG